MYLVLYTGQQVKIQIWRFLSYGRAQISVAPDWDFTFSPSKEPDAPLSHISLHNTTFFPMVIPFQSLWARESFVTMEFQVFIRKSSKIVSSFILLKVQNASWSLSVIALLDQGLVSFYVTLFPANCLCCILVEQFLGVRVHWWLSYNIISCNSSVSSNMTWRDAWEMSPFIHTSSAVLKSWLCSIQTDCI